VNEPMVGTGNPRFDLSRVNSIFLLIHKTTVLTSSAAYYGSMAVADYAYRYCALLFKIP
jgi:hypothetical protein